ncbi:WD repeat-containing protein 16, partial [Colius striatus]
GHIPCGLMCHPDTKHILYALGCTVVIQELDSKRRSFLHGHTNNVSCVVISRDGVYVASGQVTSMSSKVDTIILWDFQSKELLARLALHRGKIEGLAFSPTNLYLASLGGQDDGRLVVWDVGMREAICGSPASPCSTGSTTILLSSSCSDQLFVTAGNGTVRVWELDVTNRKIHQAECQTGKLRRVAMCAKITDDDTYFYVGTSSGDILKVNTNSKMMTDFGPQKKKFILGVTALLLLKSGEVIVGTGEGIVALCKSSSYKVMKKMQVEGAVTSLTCRGQGHQFFVGTNKCQIYQVDFAEFTEELLSTSHSEAVHDIVFPSGTSDLFVTCSKNDIRVWHTPENRELLKIVVPNVTCHAIEVTRDGSSIISAWSDGRIRAFLPEDGKPMFVVENAHSRGVTAIAATFDGRRLLSGGEEGQV